MALTCRTNLVATCEEAGSEVHCYCLFEIELGGLETMLSQQRAGKQDTRKKDSCENERCILRRQCTYEEVGCHSHVPCIFTLARVWKHGSFFEPHKGT